MLVHEKDQYTDVLPIALKQTKAGPCSSGTPFLVMYSNIKPFDKWRHQPV